MITQQTVHTIASLSRLHIADKELETFHKNLEDILTYVDQLAQLDVKEVQPTTHVLALKNVFREDVVKPSLPQTEVLKLAVEHSSESFKVPRVIE